MTFLITRSLKTGGHQDPLVCSNPSHKFDHFFNTIIWALVPRSVQSFVAKNSTSLECLCCVSAARVVIRWVGVKNYTTFMAHVVRGAALACAMTGFGWICANIPRRDWNRVCVHLLLAPGIVGMRSAHFLSCFCAGCLRCCLYPEKIQVNFFVILSMSFSYFIATYTYPLLYGNKKKGPTGIRTRNTRFKV